MYIVKVTFPHCEFAGELSDMREWLDSRRCTPTNFIYQKSRHGMTALLSFRNAVDSTDFALRFGGVVLSDHPLADDADAAVEQLGQGT